VLSFATVNLPENKKVFYICTNGGNASYKSIEEIAKKKHAVEIGRFSCKGYDTFGPFKLVGGLAKGHPDNKDLEDAVSFFKGLE
jgi:flavodoxin